MAEAVPVNGSTRPPIRLVRSDEARLPTEHGNFRIVAFTEEATGKEHLAIVAGETEGRHGVLVRLHSECLTGDVLGSKRCDCGAQLDLALSRIADEGGVVLYLRQEGRGIGLANKVRAYHLQDQGMDTIQANLHLGFPADARCYTVAAEILDALGVQCVRLMTNNPDKVEKLRKKGIEVVAREPHEIPPNDENRAYLVTKRDKMSHTLVIDPEP
ncbi:MAG: GTP cyclohydrolase II [Euryarchaeota archaeon]|nr:GTP cyclohydrolase II [Euryarchaeota archaeon]